MVSVATIRGWHAAAASAGVSATSLRRLVASGQLAARRGDDGVYEFEAADLAALHERGRDRCPPPPRTVAASVGAAQIPADDGGDHVADDDLDGPTPLGQTASAWPPSADELRLRGYERVIETATMPVAAAPPPVVYFTAAATTTVVAPPSAWREERVASIAYAIASELAWAGWPPLAIDVAWRAAWWALAALDDGWLASDWAIRVGRHAAGAAVTG